MKKSLFIVALASICLFARIDPFELPSSSSQEADLFDFDDLDMGTAVFPEVGSSSSTSSVTYSKAKVESHSSSSSSSTAQKPLASISYGFGKIDFFENSFLLITSDPIKRSFMIDKPKKLVIDFNKKRDFATKSYTIHHPLFTKVELGSHKSYYRLAVTIQGDCRYRIEKQEEGYLVSCH